jgi:hypothetical protein
MTSSLANTVIHHLWQTEEGQPPPRVYAILDAARDERIYPKILAANNESICLHPGKKAEELAWVAPYLVTLAHADALTRWVLTNGWGKSWGVFVRSHAAFSELKRHFRSLLMVYDEEGKSLYFRYYDPRVLRVFLPTCNAGEIKTFFGPVDVFVLENEDPAACLKIGPNDKGIRTEVVKMS